ncbi:MAG: hypothetical protein DYG90_06880, partial [Chloroflexi bacterium CFX6]|nr:hypothetical protein [Chloroflexi bacterium CFX6]
MIEIDLLGGFRARWDGTEIRRLPRRAVGDMWVYLLVHHDVPLLVPQLAAAFWPDVPDDKARGNLRRHLYFLTSTLPAEDPAAPWLLRDRQVVQWNPAAPFTLDLVRFENALRRGRHAADDDHHAAIEHLESARWLYRGDLVPEGEAAWLAPHRDRMRAQWVHGLELLARLKASTGDLTGAADVAETLCSAAPRSATAHALTMWVHAAAGRPDRALALWEGIRAGQEADGVPGPSDEIAALAAAIRDSGDLSPWHPARRLQQPFGLSAAPGAPGDARPAGNVPLPADAFIGRGPEIADITRLLSVSRLVTLVGLGGAGKSRLAVETARRVADQYRDGVWWVDMAAIADPALADRTIGLALGVQPGPGRSPRDAIANRLREREALIILDNCEHLVEACADAAAWLVQASDGVAVLSTSRERLGAMGEVAWPVPALSVPGEEMAVPETLLEHDAVRLFVARVREAWPEFQATPERLRAAARIVRMVEGIPLAIELAAARVGVLDVGDIAGRLDRGLSILARTGYAHAERHRSLDTAIAWGHDLLSEAERMVLRRVAVFVGGFTPPAAQSVCVDRLDPRLPHIPGHIDIDEIVDRLADKSFLTDGTARGQGRRYRLPEVVRVFSLARLAEADETAAVRRAHAEHFVAWVEDVAPHLMQADADAWMDRLDREHGNLRAVAAWVTETETWGSGIRLASAIWRFWHIRGHVGPERVWLDRVLDVHHGDAPVERLARAYHGAGILAYDQGDHAAAGRHWRMSLDRWNQLGSREMAAPLLFNLGLLAMVQGRFGEAEGFAEQALAIRLDDDKPDAVALVYGLLADIATRQGDHATAYARLRESYAILEAADASDVRMFNVLRGLGRVALALGNYADSERYMTEWLERGRASRNKRETAASLSLLGMLHSETGRFGEAAGCFREAVAILRDIDSPDELARVFHNMGELARVQGQTAMARTYIARSLDMKEALGDAWNIMFSRVALAEIAADGEDPAAARDAVVAALEAARGFGARSL